MINFSLCFSKSEHLQATIARTISRTVQFPNGTSRRLRSETNTFDSASETDSNSNGDDSSSDNNALGANNQNLDQQNDLDYMQNDHTMSNNSHFYHNANLSEVSNNADYAVESAQQDVISADNNNDNAIGMEVYHTNEFNEEQGGEEDDREAELEDFDDDGLYSASTRSNDTGTPEDNFETIPRLDFISQLTAFISNGHK